MRLTASPLRHWSVCHCAQRLGISRRAISFSKLTIERKTDSISFDKRPAKEDLVFGTTSADHMLMIAWDKQSKWSAPRIVPYGDLNISPAASGLHYGMQCFEGMKAYKAVDGSLRLFRPDMNMKRLAASMTRLHLPGADFDHNELIRCIQELVRVDEKWIPEGDGYSLYLRPTVIATHPHLGVTVPSSLLLYVITSPVGPYYSTGGFDPVRLTADTPYVRAWPGGTGGSKVGGNYGAVMKAQDEAANDGYNQVLWLFGEDDSITEVGAMNVFFVLRNKETGRTELVTPPLDRGDILPGVTRDSILHLARHWEDELDVVERFPTMPEIQQAAEEGRLLEAFGAGTAAVVTSISCIQYQGTDIEVAAPGQLTQRVFDEITSIQYGKRKGPDGWSVVIE